MIARFNIDVKQIAASALIAVLVIVASGCASEPPRTTTNACKLFKEKKSWRKHTYKSARKWKTDMAVMLAIMKFESGFDANAKPRRKRFLGIPLRRPSSAFGFPQALDNTWDVYRKDSGNFIAHRDRFRDAMDFIGWYVGQSRKRLRISPSDGYRNYLAYHEGWGGYARGTYKSRKKKWLVRRAKEVSLQANLYREQMKRCKIKMPRSK